MSKPQDKIDPIWFSCENMIFYVISNYQKHVILGNYKKVKSQIYHMAPLFSVASWQYVIQLPYFPE